MNKIENIIKEITNSGTITSNDIPSLDLYMDQIMTLFDTYLSSHKRYETDKLLTKTMINNYSKEGVIKPIKGKKYTKDHILEILLVYSLKNTITIPEIKTILEDCHENRNIEEIYNKYLEVSREIVNKESQEIIEYFQSKKMQDTQKEDLLLMILTLSSLSNFYKKICEKIIDTYYEDNTKRRK